MLGVNTTDSRKFVQQYVAKYGVTFPMLHDTSDEADSALARYSTLGVTHPLTYAIDVHGKVQHAWAGYDHAKTEKVLQELFSPEKQN